MTSEGNDKASALLRKGDPPSLQHMISLISISSPFFCASASAARKNTRRSFWKLGWFKEPSLADRSRSWRAAAWLADIPQVYWW